MIGAFVDPKVITGAPAWLKPAKFSISFVIYSLTLVWLLSYVENHRGLVRVVANVTVITSAIEMVIIIGQVFRNTTSHFNFSTPLNKLLWGTMGAAIIVLWLMTLLTAILLIRQKMTDKVHAWGLRLGVLVTLVGLALGYFMTFHQTSRQAALAEAGQDMLTYGAHSFGVEDGGAGLPFVGWNTTGGDLRPAHFIAFTRCRSCRFSVGFERLAQIKIKRKTATQIDLDFWRDIFGRADAADVAVSPRTINRQHGFSNGCGFCHLDCSRDFNELRYCPNAFSNIGNS